MFDNNFSNSKAPGVVFCSSVGLGGERGVQIGHAGRKETQFCRGIKRVAPAQHQEVDGGEGVAS